MTIYKTSETKPRPPMHAHIWTNGAYHLSGAYLMLAGNAFAGFFVLCLGSASWSAHKRGGRWWALDWAAMYAAFIAVIASNLAAQLGALGEPTPLVWLTYGACLAVAFAFYRVAIVWPKKAPQDTELVGILFVVALFSCAIAGGPWLLALSVFATGLFIRQMAPSMGDEYYDLCHGAWHIVTAIGFTVLAA